MNAEARQLPPPLYRLSEAVELFFPTGGITVKTLRTEARRGRLQTITLANKTFVTAEAISAMLERCKSCPVKDSPPAYISENAQAASRNGSSAMERTKQARAALQAMLPARARRLKDI
jgi:hypothetical protein